MTTESRAYLESETSVLLDAVLIETDAPTVVRNRRTDVSGVSALAPKVAIGVINDVIKTTKMPQINVRPRMRGSSRNKVNGYSLEQ